MDVRKELEANVKSVFLWAIALAFILFIGAMGYPEIMITILCLVVAIQAWELWQKHGKTNKK